VRDKQKKQKKFVKDCFDTEGDANGLDSDCRKIAGKW